MLVIHPDARAKNGPTEQLEVVDALFEPEATTLSNFLHTICRCDCTRGKYEIEEANAQFICLARNAFDVMMRRGWSVRPNCDCFGKPLPGWKVEKIEADGYTSNWVNCELAFHHPDPFTALVEADKWYRKNVEREPKE